MHRRQTNLETAPAMGIFVLSNNVFWINQNLTRFGKPGFALLNYFFT